MAAVPNITRSQRTLAEEARGEADRIRFAVRRQLRYWLSGGTSSDAQHDEADLRTLPWVLGAHDRVLIRSNTVGRAGGAGLRHRRKYRDCSRGKLAS